MSCIYCIIVGCLFDILLDCSRRFLVMMRRKCLTVLSMKKCATRGSCQPKLLPSWDEWVN